MPLHEQRESLRPFSSISLDCLKTHEPTFKQYPPFVIMETVNNDDLLDRADYIELRNEFNFLKEKLKIVGRKLINVMTKGNLMDFDYHQAWSLVDFMHYQDESRRAMVKVIHGFPRSSIPYSSIMLEGKMLEGGMDEAIMLAKELVNAGKCHK